MGRPEPDLVFPNHGDHAYAKVELDDRSVDYVRSRLNNVDDELLRQLLWASLWEMVRDQRLSSVEYLAIASDQLPAETDLDILEIVLERVAILLRRYVPESRIQAEAHAWFELALASLAVMREETGRAAVALLDDLDSELDEERAGALCAEVARRGQAWVTTAHAGWAESLRRLGRLYEVSQGAVRCAS